MVYYLLHLRFLQTPGGKLSVTIRGRIRAMMDSEIPFPIHGAVQLNPPIDRSRDRSNRQPQLQSSARSFSSQSQGLTYLLTYDSLYQLIPGIEPLSWSHSSQQTDGNDTRASTPGGTNL